MTRRFRASRLALLSMTAAALTMGAACSTVPQRPQVANAPEGMTAKPDRQMQAVLDQLQALGGRPLETLAPEEARRQPTPADAVKSLLAKRGQAAAPEAVARVQDGLIPGPGGPIPVRVYWPQGFAPEQAGQPPVTLYIHGGGWVIADLDTYDASARALANASRAIVVSTHYRQAPEHRFPAAHEDTWAAWKWTVANAQALGGHPQRVTVAGESAGGNMAAAVALRARDEKFQQPAHQLLVYPVTDLLIGSASEKENEKAKPLATPTLSWFYSQYLGTPADAKNPRFSLMDADVRGVAPATVITADIDPLRSEGAAYAEKLRTAGVPVDYRNYRGVTHEFFGMGAVVDQARQAVQYAADNMHQTLERAATAGTGSTPASAAGSGTQSIQR